MGVGYVLDYFLARAGYSQWRLQEVTGPSQEIDWHITHIQKKHLSLRYFRKYWKMSAQKDFFMLQVFFVQQSKIQKHSSLSDLKQRNWNLRMFDILAW